MMLSAPAQACDSRDGALYPVPLAVRWLYESSLVRANDRGTRESPDKSGGGGIRTHGELAPSAVFKTALFNRSSTPPMR
jgi:hypothetical protein